MIPQRVPIRRGCKALVATWLLLAAAQCVTGLALAQAVTGDRRPYDAKLFRLAEILGAVHYLRELCGANEGQTWRDRMSALLAEEGATALRRAALTNSFNNGYRSYSRTYQSCTPSAQTAIARFLTEGAQLADELAKVPN